MVSIKGIYSNKTVAVIQMFLFFIKNLKSGKNGH